MEPNMQNYQLTKGEMLALLDRSKMGVIATVGADGSPYATPINYILMDGRVFFHGRKQGMKMANLEKDPRCSFTVVDEGGFERCGDDACNTTSIYESVIVKGRVEVIEDFETKKKVLRTTVDKLTPERKTDSMNEKAVGPAGVYEIVVEEMTGKYHRPMPENRIFKA